MKEAAGEANMTVITIVLIGVVAAVGMVFIPRLLENMNARSCCTEHGGTWDNSVCKGSDLGENLFMSSLKKNKDC